MSRQTSRNKRKQRGFTLIEVLISTMVFAIVMIATISLTNSTVGLAHTSYKTQIGGALIAQTLEMMTVDALRWQTNSRVGLRYMGGNGSYVISTQATTNWNKYTDFPVNYQMRYSEDPSTTAAGRGAKFCIYFAYRWAGTDANVTDFLDELMEINIAAFTPRNPNGLSNTDPACPNAANMFANCNVGIMGNACAIQGRRNQFIRVSRAAMIRRNRSGF